MIPVGRSVTIQASGGWAACRPPPTMAVQETAGRDPLMSRLFAASLVLWAAAALPVRAAERPSGATLTVRTSPQGARIFLDGAPAGTTPRAFAGLVPGAHQVQLQMVGRKAVERQVRLARRERKTI